MSDKKHDVNAVTTEPNVEDQDYIYTPVPQNKRYGWIKMFFVWLCWNVVVGDLATGTALGSSMKSRNLQNIIDEHQQQIAALIDRLGKQLLVGLV